MLASPTYANALVVKVKHKLVTAENQNPVDVLQSYRSAVAPH
jgi:hypothetical protein